MNSSSRLRETVDDSSEPLSNSKVVSRSMRPKFIFTLEPQKEKDEQEENKRILDIITFHEQRLDASTNISPQKKLLPQTHSIAIDKVRKASSGKPIKNSPSPVLSNQLEEDSFYSIDLSEDQSLFSEEEEEDGP